MGFLKRHSLWSTPDQKYQNSQHTFSITLLIEFIIHLTFCEQEFPKIFFKFYEKMSVTNSEFSEDGQETDENYIGVTIFKFSSNSKFVESILLKSGISSRNTLAIDLSMENVTELAEQFYPIEINTKATIEKG